MMSTIILLVKKYSQRRIVDGACARSIKILLTAFLIHPSNSIAASINNSECILNNNTAVRALSEGNFSGEFGCEYGSRFLKINDRGGNYNIYNYIYRFSTSAEGVVHGGQRIIFFNSGMEYVGQFSIGAPYNGKRYHLIILKKGVLMINDGDKNVGKILLSNPPSGTLYNENLEFFK